MKTDDEIAREKDAVQKMVGAKSAMEAALARINRLEKALSNANTILADVQKSVGDTLCVKTFYHGLRDNGQQTQRPDRLRPPHHRRGGLMQGEIEDGEISRLRKALSLTKRADELREIYHRLPNDKNRIGEKRSPKGHARDAWLRAFRKAARAARTALAEGETR